MKLVAVTSCPTGIAHTYMAAESLEVAAKEAGHEISVETQGAAGASPLAPELITSADAVIFAADVEVRGRERFVGKPLVKASVKRGIDNAAGLVAEATALAGAASAAAASAGGEASTAPGPARPQHDDVFAALTTKLEPGAGIGTRLRQWLMTGVSYMIPFVAAGGILIALSFLIGGASVADKVAGGTFQHHAYAAITDLTTIYHKVGIAGVMYEIGTTAFSMLVPILAGFIAFAIADRPGIAPGIVAGLIASNVHAGFLGGLLGGLLAGGVTLAILRVRVPRGMAGIMPVVVIPLISTLIVGFIMLEGIGSPIATAQHGLTTALNGMTGTSGIVLGLLLGAMMAFDMGGPVNKTAYTFALASLASGNLKIMAAVMAAGMTPPLALALASTARPKLFTPAERKAGEAAWLLGLSFITEGAIPFAAADPLRVIPSLMSGSAVTGALSMAFGATSRAPHGGVWVIGLIGHPELYLAAILTGMVFSAAIVVVLKGTRRVTLAESDKLANAATAGAAPAVRAEQREPSAPVAA